MKGRGAWYDICIWNPIDNIFYKAKRSITENKKKPDSLYGFISRWDRSGYCSYG